jgi:integrase
VHQTLQDADGEVFFKAPKTKRGERSITLLPVTVEALRRHTAARNAGKSEQGAAYRDNDLVVCRNDERPWRPGSFTAAWNHRTERNGLKVNFRELRHTLASRLLPIESIRRWSRSVWGTARSSLPWTPARM